MNTYMPRYTTIAMGDHPRAKAEWEIHATGCMDIPRTLKRLPFGGDSWVQTAESAEALVDEEVSVFEDQDQGWNHGDHYIHGCASANGRGGIAVDRR